MDLDFNEIPLDFKHIPVDFKHIPLDFEHIPLDFEFQMSIYYRKPVLWIPSLLEQNFKVTQTSVASSGKIFETSF